MPRSIFLGRPTPEPGESLWTDEDRAWALALTMEESEVCPGCGQPLSECSDPRNEWGYEATPWKCHACTAKDAAGGEFENSQGTYYLTVGRR